MENDAYDPRWDIQNSEVVGEAYRPTKAAIVSLSCSLSCALIEAGRGDASARSVSSDPVLRWGGTGNRPMLPNEMTVAVDVRLESAIFEMRDGASTWSFTGSRTTMSDMVGVDSGVVHESVVDPDDRVD